MTLASVDRYTPDRVQHLGRRAVVLGGSIAGLCAARVLADAFEEVVVLERDEFPDRAVSRSGAPQTSHPHAMLEAGRATLEDLFPGFGEAVLSAGGLLIDGGSDARWYDQGAFVANTAERLPMYCASRALFEHLVREKVRAIDSVRLQGNCQFTDYQLTDGSVTGVRYRDESGTDKHLDSTLVVDATGRTSRTPQWLERQGYPSPDVDEVTVDVTYSTIRIDRPPAERWSLFLAPEPERPRGAAMIPIEDDQWEVIFQGLHGERAPTDREHFCRWAGEYPIEAIGRLVDEQEWRSGDIDHYPFPSSRRNHYERLDRFPEGLVVTGDAIASFNPIYGQGMSVAALDALVFHHELATGLDGIGPRFFDQTSGIVDDVWRVAVGNDFVFSETTGPKPFGTDLFNAYFERLIRRAHDDGALTEAFLRVFRLERPATSLLHPAVLWRVFRPKLGRATGGTESGERTGKPPSDSLAD